MAADEEGDHIALRAEAQADGQRDQRQDGERGV
jgi:hypothetical protein